LKCGHKIFKKTIKRRGTKQRLGVERRVFNRKSYHARQRKRKEEKSTMGVPRWMLVREIKTNGVNEGRR